MASAPSLASPSPDKTLALYRRIEPWIRNWAVPDNAATSESVPGVCVTLRVSGRVVGRGQDLSDSPQAAWNATRKAMREAESVLGIDPAHAPERIAAIAAAVEVSLEAAGTLVPFTAPTYSDVDLGVRAGLEGIAVRSADRTVAVFPNTCLVAGFQPSEALRAAISDVTGDPNIALDGAPGGQPAALAKSHGLTFYRFRATSLVQPAAGDRPVFTHRGARLVEGKAVDQAMLIALRNDLLKHLINRVAREPGSRETPAAGLLVPSRDNPVVAPASRFELALTAFALGRSVAPDPLGSQAASAARGILQSLASAATADEPMSPTDAAMVLLAIQALAGEGDWPALAVAARTSLNGAFKADGGWAPDLAGGRALIAFALTKAARNESERSTASAAVRSLFRETAPGMLTGHMPWLGWAELELRVPRSPPPAAEAMREMRDQLYAHQVREEDAEAADADLVGGFVFTASSSPFPTWQSTRPMPFLASMLAEPTLTDDRELLKYLTRSLSSMRFLRQLTADEVVGHLYPARGLARGGVRAAVWDQRQPIEASCMGLLAVSETLRAIDAAIARMSAASPPPPAGR